ncbi:MAG: HU family DNA-binding protein [Rhodobacterales bacterium]|nr:HU family DNA-binding protein [Rhodobacterales bacterium]
MAPRSTKTTEKKPAKSAKAKAQPAAVPKADEKPAETAAPVAQGALRLKDLVESVATATGGRKPEVKAAVEATLRAMGEALSTGKALAVPPLGKLRVVKSNGPALTLKLRRTEAGKVAGKALAAVEEDS